MAEGTDGILTGRYACAHRKRTYDLPSSIAVSLALRQATPKCQEAGPKAIYEALHAHLGQHTFLQCYAWPTDRLRHETAGSPCRAL